MNRRSAPQEIRNPKSEIRKKAEARRPNSEGQHGPYSDFGLEPSFGFRIPDSGFHPPGCRINPAFRGGLLLLSSTLMVAGPWHMGAAERNLAGRGVFRQECARCHGREGQGVKGKFEGPLQGDRSLEKLTRYIERAMPDDNPGKLSAERSAAVAHYIYDAFYSWEARARKNPARIELARLTNRQYVTTIADLIRQFRGPEHPLSGERGLRATYYNFRHFDSAKKAFERTDRQVDFDFGEASPDREHGTNEFSIHWTGSIIAPETGVYEFILKTPNGARLWVIDDEEPLIDAWVASGELSEHRATLRLLGGRAYPLRLNCFKFQQKRGSISLQWRPPHGTQEPVPARNLCPDQTRATLVITTPFPADDSSVGYERGVGVSKAWDEAATSAAIETANYVVQNLDGLSQSKPGDTNRLAKVEAFCEEFVSAAFGRPLTQEQKRAFISTHFQTRSGRRKEVQPGKSEIRNPKSEIGRSLSAPAPTMNLEEAVRRVVLLALKSPRFLYPGLEEGKPDGYSVAKRLSYGLWDSLPDQELLKAAARGKLRTEQQVAQQARRLLEDPRARVKMLQFLHHWLQLDRVEPLAKDNQVFPGFTPQIIADLRTSLDLFLEEAVWKGGSDYRTLLQADYLFLNERLAAFYGVQHNSSEDPTDFVKVNFGGEHRSGVLTHPYLLSAFSYSKLTSPIHRGVFLTRNIVGRALKPPPMAMTFKDADFAPGLTMREKVSQLTRPQACQACHSVINPLGFSLEAYDAVGRFRTQENAHPVNAESEYAASDGQIVHLAGARDVAEFALNNEQAQIGFIEQLFSHVVKQPARAYGPAVLEQLRQSFVASEFNLRKLLVAIVTVSSLQGLEPTSRK